MVCNAGGARLGTYSPIKRALGGDEEHISLLRNLVAGSVSGGFAAAVTNPLDLIKTRLQSKGTPYRTISQVVRAVVKDEGVVGLWSGTMPSVVSYFCHMMHCMTLHAISVDVMKDEGVEGTCLAPCLLCCAALPACSRS